MEKELQHNDIKPLSGNTIKNSVSNFCVNPLLILNYSSGEIAMARRKNILSGEVIIMSIR